MVYSTAKPKVAAQIEKLGVNLAPKKIEIRDGADFTESFLKDEIKSTPKSVEAVKSSSVKPQPQANLMTGRLKNTNLTGIEDMGGTVKASTSTTTTGPHPIYSLMAGKTGNQSGPTTPGGKKKIVIPPKGAY